MVVSTSIPPSSSTCTSCQRLCRGEPIALICASSSTMQACGRRRRMPPTSISSMLPPRHATAPAESSPGPWSADQSLRAAAPGTLSRRPLRAPSAHRRPPAFGTFCRRLPRTRGRSSGDPRSFSHAGSSRPKEERRGHRCHAPRGSGGARDYRATVFANSASWFVRRRSGSRRASAHTARQPRHRIFALQHFHARARSPGLRQRIVEGLRSPSERSGLLDAIASTSQ